MYSQKARLRAENRRRRRSLWERLCLKGKGQIRLRFGFSADKGTGSAGPCGGSDRGL